MTDPQPPAPSFRHVHTTLLGAAGNDRLLGQRIGPARRTEDGWAGAMPVAIRERPLERQQPIAEVFDPLVSLDFITFRSVGDQHILQGPVVIPGFEPYGLSILFVAPDHEAHSNFRERRRAFTRPYDRIRRRLAR